MTEVIHEIPETTVRSWMVHGSGYGARPRRSGMDDVLAYARREGIPILIPTLRVERIGDRLFIRGERGGVFDHSDMD